MTHANGVGYNVASPQVATVIVYVKIDSPQMDQYKLDFFSSIGGQTHVRCSCTGFPLIISGTYRKDKRKCMQSTCVWEERLICSNNACTSRICRKCFEGFPISSITTINPPLGEDSGSAGNDNLKSDNGFDDDRWHDVVRKTRSLLTIPVNITSVKVPMMLTKIIGMMI
jgi:hypothetical protein